MNDRGLLELAAKAAGMEGCAVDYDDRLVFLQDGKPSSLEWNPLHNDGDALRLAVRLQMFRIGEVWVIEQTSIAEWERDPYAATRRAITRAAAEIGRSMK